MTVSKKKCLSHLTFQEIEKELLRLPALILPLGGCEPYGACGSLGAATACAEALATALSEKSDTLYAPALPFGCSTAYGAFGGTAGVKPRTLTNILCEAIRRWHAQGFRTIIIIDCLFDNYEAAEAAVLRLKNTNPGLKIIYFSLQRDERVRAFIERHIREKEPGRTEFGLLSLAAFIDRTLARPAGKKDVTAAADAKTYVTWRKRSADPQQFRKFFPECSSSNAARRFDHKFGRELFDYILQLLVDTATPHLQNNNQ